MFELKMLPYPESPTQEGSPIRRTFSLSSLPVSAPPGPPPPHTPPAVVRSPPPPPPPPEKALANSIQYSQSLSCPDPLPYPYPHPL